MTRVCAGDPLAGGLLTIPSTGIWLMAEDDNNFTTAGSGAGTKGVEVASMLNRRMAGHRRHFFWVNPGTRFGNFPTAACLADAALRSPRVMPFDTWGSQGSSFPVKTNATAKAGSNNTAKNSKGHTGMDRVSDGEFDAQITLEAKDIAAIPGPVIFNLWQEMNIPAMNCYGGYQGGTGGAGQAVYKGAYAHVVNLFRAAGAKNVVFVWCPTAYDPDNNMLTYYPGDDVVDVIGIDLYRDSVNVTIDPIYNFAVAHGKGLIICENGYDDGKTVACSDGVKRDKDGRVTGKSLVEELHSSVLSAKYDNIIGVTPWVVKATAHDNHLDTTPLALTQYKAFAADSDAQNFYLGGPVTPGTAPNWHGGPGLSSLSPVDGDTLLIDTSMLTGIPDPAVTQQWQWADPPPA